MSLARGWRRPIFWLAMMLGLLALFELSSLLGLLILGESPFSVARSRGMLLSGVVNLESPRRVRSVLHPLIGYVREETGAGAAMPGPSLERARSVYGTVNRDPAVPRRGAGQVIVALTGGSVAQQVADLGGEVLVRRLQRSRRYAGKEVLVVSLAAGGFKQPQQLMGLQYLLVLGAEIDVLVNLDGFNEVALHPFENAPSRTFYAYPRLWQAMTGILYRDNARILGKLAFFRSLRLRWAAYFEQSFGGRTASGNLLWEVGNRMIDRRVLKAGTALRLIEEQQALAAGAGPPTGEAQMYQQLVELWTEASMQLDRLCRANGIRYFHFLQPNQYVVGSKPMSAEERSLAISEGQGYRVGAEFGYPLLIEAGRSKLQGAVAYTDLTMLFAETREVVYTDDCCHFNRRGVRKIAQRIADEILRL